jgi:hypothetical protein
VSDYGFVGPRSSAVASTLLGLAEKAGLEPGVVRTTIGGYYVPVSLAKAYETTLGAKPEEPVEADEKSDFPDDSWKNADIKEWASAHEVDLGEATKKADMLAAIQAHKEE